jgi:hypothetical protein
VLPSKTAGSFDLQLDNGEVHAFHVDKRKTEHASRYEVARIRKKYCTVFSVVMAFANFFSRDGLRQLLQS